MTALTGIGPNPSGMRYSPIQQAITGYARPVDQVATAGPAPVAGYNGPLAGLSFAGQPFSFYLGGILLLFLYKFLSEHPNIPLNPQHVHIGIYNVLAITTVAAIGIASAKVVFTRWPIPGLTQFVNYV